MRFEVPYRFVLYAEVAAFVLWLPLAVMDWGGQRQLFYSQGTELLSDYWMPRTCVVEGYSDAAGAVPDGESGWVDGRMYVAARDRCYPAAALMPFLAFPQDWSGAWAWTVLQAVLLVSVLCLVARSASPLLLVCSMPILFNLERGNPICLAAAGVAVFLAWYRSPHRWQRIVAALGLSCATCFKISPVLLGLLYLRERDWESIGYCILFCSVIFFVPWFFVPGGLSALPVMLDNAHTNYMSYVRAADFGFVQLWRAVRVALHQDCDHVWTGCLVVARLSQTVGLAAIAWGAWKRNHLFVVAGMLWAAGNMHYYGTLYLLPLFVLAASDRSARPLTIPAAALWFVILCPFQFLLLGHSANAILANIAIVALLLESRE